MKATRRHSRLVALALAVVLAGCGAAPARPSGAGAPNASEEQPAPAAPAVAPADNVLRIALADGAWPDTLDPQKASFTQEIAVLALNYEGLTRFDRHLKTVPAAAEKWESNAQSTEWTFTLRDDLKYSDGTRLSARDFAEAIYYSLDPRSPGDYQQTFFMIKGAAEIVNTAVPTDAARLPVLKRRLGVETPNDRTIRFKLTQPTPYFPTLTGIWVAYPSKQSSFATGELWWENPALMVGNGPFQITKIDGTNGVIEFRANPHYWAGKAKLAGVRMLYMDDAVVGLQAYRNGEVDMLKPDANDIVTLKGDPQLSKELHEYAGACTIGFEFNLARQPFDNRKVREAFAYAFDRRSFIRDVLKDSGVETLTWISPGYPGYDDDERRFAFDPERARRVLAEAGFPEGRDLPEIKLTYPSNNPYQQARNEYLVQMYKKNLGVDLVLDPVDGATLVAMQKDAQTFPQFVRGGWCADYPDQQSWLSTFWHSRTQFARNIGYRNSAADRLMDAADGETDPAKRRDLYRQAQDLIVGDVPMAIVYNPKNVFLVKPYVAGLELTPQDGMYPGAQLSLHHVEFAR
jgi:oligopeptide transport system substrate-binding protein